MHHVDPETLGLLALGESVESESDRAHLLVCSECATSLRELTGAASIGRTVLDVGTVEQPDSRVWEKIRAELDFAQEPPAQEPTVQEPPVQEAPAQEPPVQSTDAVVSPIGRKRRAGLILLTAAAAVVALVAGGVFWGVSQAKSSRTVASATLTAFPKWTGSTGSAVVDELSDGERVVSVSLTAPQDAGTFHEVWLITSNAKQLVSLGRIRGNSGVFAVPDGTDLSTFDLLDVSAEPRDGNPAHSGNSIVRGTLEP